MTLTAERLRQLLAYDPATGNFTWLVSRGRCVAGELSGKRHPEGYWQIKIDGRSYLAHRLAWLYTYGVWPTHVVDHIDMNPSNNAITNLRAADVGENTRNCTKRSNNTSGFKGVFASSNGKRWRAMICRDRKQTYLGTFDDPAQAHAAYCAAASKFHGEFARIK